MEPAGVEDADRAGEERGGGGGPHRPVVRPRRHGVHRVGGRGQQRTNAAVLWTTTTYLGDALDALRADGYPWRTKTRPT